MYGHAIAGHPAGATTNAGKKMNPDPDAIIVDPLAGRWKFAHFGGGSLHPTAAGDAEIAQKAGAILQAHGITADSSATAVPLTCRVSTGAGSDTGDHGTPGDA